MSAVLPIVFAAPLLGLALQLGLIANLITLALVFAMFGIGCVACRALGASDNPFLGFVTGFVLLAHALVGANFLVPGAHWQILAGVAVVGLPAYRPGFWRAATLRLPTAIWLGVLGSLFTFIWCADIGPRLDHFWSTGEFPFWADTFVHAGTIAQFGSPTAIGRGMILLADMPQPLYHIASYLPVALHVELAGTAPLTATLLNWIPLGVLVMVCGVTALALALEGPCLAVMSILALALVPDPSRLALGNGFLSFPWLLEAHPGALYSFGVACAALAALVRGLRKSSRTMLALAWGLTAGCFMVRVNTFVWLAPVVFFGTIAGSRGLLSARQRLALTIAGIVGIFGILAVFSLPDMLKDPHRFLLSYIEAVNLGNGPTYVDALYPALVASLGPYVAGIFGLALILFGNIGPWLPAFLILAALAYRQKRLEAVDALPFLLLLTVVIATFVAPYPRNGDIGEFRHRAGPLVILVVAIWTLRFSSVYLLPRFERQSVLVQRTSLVGLGVVAFTVLALTIGSLKRPRMAWTAAVFHTSHVPLEFVTLARSLQEEANAKMRFVVADQPADARAYDDASRLAALSGVPAFISCPQIMTTYGGPISAEARRRMGVVAQLARASTLAELRATMLAEGITHYVVTKSSDAPFDPERKEASSHAGPFAIYAAQSM